MFRKLSYLSVLIFIVLLLMSGNSQAGITTNVPTVSSGETVTITINSQEKVASGALNVTSNEGLTFVSVSGGQANGTLLAFASSENKTSGIATYKFKAPEVKENKTFKIKFSSYDMADADGNEILSSTATATVTVKAKTTSSGGTSSSSSSSGETTTKTPSFSSVNETVYATDDVNVRASYSTSSSLVGTLNKGESVKRTGIGDNGWSKVTFNGKTAYIYSTYLTKTKPVVEKPKEDPKPNDSSSEQKNETINNVTNNTIDNNTTNNTIDNNTISSEIKENNEPLRLSNLEISGVSFTDGFKPEIYLYEINLNFFVKELKITAVANKEDAKIEILGNENFKEGENNITILVKSTDGKETVTYQVKVIVPSEVEDSPQNNIQFYLICGGITLVAIIAIVVVIAIYNSQNKIEKEDYEDINTEDEKTKKAKGKHSN